MAYQKLKIYRVGEKKLQKCGMEATIIAYPSGADMKVQFEDGKIVDHVSYYDFSQGNLNYNKNDTLQMSKSYRIGEKCVCTNEMIATIIAYRSYHDIDVQFDDGLVVEHISYARFFQRSVPHPDHKVVFWPRNLGKHIGMKKRTLDGYRELLAVHDDHTVDYIDDDGTTVYNSWNQDFLRKNTSLHKHKDRRTGQIVDQVC